MGDCVLVMEEGVPRLDSVASVTGSVVQIDSIEIDLRSSMEPPKPERFSIRGYVADMRKKNRKACLPFGDADDKLPPMAVPSFRWWQCPTWVPDTDAQRGTKGKMVVETAAGTDSLQNVEDEDCIILHSTENRGVGDKAGTSCDTSEANQLRIVERLDNTTDVTDMVCASVRPSCIVDNPELGNDGVPPKRKPKLRSIADIMGIERNPAAEMEAVLRPQPELDVPAEGASSERKRKTDLGEDGGPSRATCRKSAAKRIKGLHIDGGKSCGRVDICDSGSEGDASTRSDLNLGAKSEHKKTKALNNSKKMKQKIHKEDKTAPMRKAVSSSNAQKHGVPVVITFGKSGRSPSTTEETGPLFNLSKSKMPEVGDCNIRGKAVLDLNTIVDAAKDNARHTGIPDLNEEPLEGNHLALPEKSLPLHNTWDASPHCRNGTTSEGKRPFRISESENKEASQEASDDIPMDIVELLAMNQRERAVGNSRYVPGINNSPRGYSALCVDGRPSPSVTSYPHSRTCGLTLRNGNLGVTPQLNSYHRFDASRTEDSSLLWSSTRDQNAPFPLNIQPTSTCRDSVFNRSFKGKTVTDMKDTGGISTPRGSLNPYSSKDAIPAMQLLSLMDPRVAVHSSFKVGAKSSFSPSSSNHHLKKQSFQNGRLFSQDRHSAGSKNASCSYSAQLVQEAGSSKASHLARSDSEFGVCTLNRNPADFSFPDARNEFTISAKDLKFRKRNNSRMLNIEAKKGRQRMRS